MTPEARRSLRRHLTNRLGPFVSLYVSLAIIERSWWRPAVTLVAGLLAATVFTRIRGRMRRPPTPDSADPPDPR